MTKENVKGKFSSVKEKTNSLEITARQAFRLKREFLLKNNHRRLYEKNIVAASIKLIIMITCKKNNRMRIKPFRFATVTILFHLLFILPASSQQPIKTYDREWKQVNGFLKKELPGSALAQVKKIYQLAKKEKQNAQLIKSLIYITGIQ